MISKKLIIIRLIISSIIISFIGFFVYIVVKICTVKNSYEEIKKETIIKNDKNEKEIEKKIEDDNKNEIKNSEIINKNNNEKEKIKETKIIEERNNIKEEERKKSEEKQIDIE